MRAVGVAAILSVALSSAVVGQEVGGLHGEVILGFGLLRQDNRTHSVGAFQTLLQSKTRTQNLTFDLDVARWPAIGTQGSAGLKYQRETKRSKLDLQLRHQERPSGALALGLLQNDESADVDRLDADMKSSSASALLRLGVGRPIGVEFDARYRRRKTLDATGARQSGRRSRLDIKTRLDLSKRSSVHTRLGFGQVDGGGVSPNIEKTQRIEVGLSHKFNARVAMDAAIGWRKIENRDNGGLTESSGGEWTFALTAARKNSKVFANLFRRVTSSGLLAEGAIGVERNLKNGRIDLSLGIARLARGGVEPTVSLSFAKTYPKSALKLKMSRGYASSDLATDVRLASRLHLRATHEIGDLGGLELRIDVVKGAASANLTAGSMQQVLFVYTHALSPDWSLAGGAQRRVTREVGTARQASNGVFLRLERRFAGGL